jgi:hypothetical protein
VIDEIGRLHGSRPARHTTVIASGAKQSKEAGLLPPSPCGLRRTQSSQVLVATIAWRDQAHKFFVEQILPAKNLFVEPIRFVEPIQCDLPDGQIT